jgi:hypothetical protein
VCTTPAFWLCIILVPIIALVPDVMYSSVKMTVWPTETDTVRIAEKARVSQVPSEGSSLLGHVQRIFRSKATDQRMQQDVEMRASSGYAFSESRDKDKVVGAYNTTKQRDKKTGR